MSLSDSDSQQMTEAVIQAAVVQGIDWYRQAKFAYWPANGSADLAEACPLVNIAAALRNIGSHIYANVQFANRPKEHFDLFALSLDGPWAMGVEAKRLYSFEKLKSLNDDWIRMKDAILPQEWLPLPSPLACYVCLLTSCWSETYAAWWRTPDTVSGGLSPSQIERVAPLREALLRSTAKEAVDVQKPGWQPHWITYAIIRLGDGQFCDQSEGAKSSVLLSEISV